MTSGFRPLLPADPQAIRALVRATGFFTPAEEEVAVELVEESLAKGAEKSGYHFHLYAGAEKLLGYACYGPVPMTLSGFDLYWIVVAPETQGKGLGARLLTACEQSVRGLGGKRLYSETSSRPLYTPTHKFYERHGFIAEARLIDFYAPGDDKIIYTKIL
ncbi:MAG: GNAT family N-acetyltransferase [Alphaproteobacteria bacterium]|nr:GNAT family N-acetyltransferase [Alphaproteobacteria bacterium]